MADKTASAVFRGSAPFLAYAPPLSLPMRHFAFAALSFLAFASALVFGNGRLLGWDFDAKWVLGAVHLLTLGWINMTILGALVQMIPVHGETPLAVPAGVIKAAWWGYVIGLIGFVFQLWSGATSYWVPAVLIASAMGVYVFALVKTLLKAKKRNWTGTHLLCAFGYLVLLATLGALLAYDQQRGDLLPRPSGAFVAHIHAALVGWVSLVIVGVSYRMVSLFSVARTRSRWPGYIALALANAGLLGLIFDCLFFAGTYKPLWATTLMLAYGAYLFQVGPWATVFPRRLEPSTLLTWLALAGGALWVALGVGLAYGWIEDTNEARAAYVYAALIGWATPFILGQVHKIAPFLIWLHVYSPRHWSPPVKVPKIDDLTSGKLAWAEFGFMIPASFLGVAGFLMESRQILLAGSVSLLLVSIAFVINTAITLKHLVFPDEQWTHGGGFPR